LIQLFLYKTKECERFMAWLIMEEEEVDGIPVNEFGRLEIVRTSTAKQKKKK